MLLPGAFEIVSAAKASGQQSAFVAQGPVRIAAASFQMAQEGFARCGGNISSGSSAALTRQATALQTRCVALIACSLSFFDVPQTASLSVVQSDCRPLVLMGGSQSCSIACRILPHPSRCDS